MRELKGFGYDKSYKGFNMNLSKAKISTIYKLDESKTNDVFECQNSNEVFKFDVNLLISEIEIIAPKGTLDNLKVNEGVEFKTLDVVILELGGEEIRFEEVLIEGSGTIEGIEVLTSNEEVDHLRVMFSSGFGKATYDADAPKDEIPVTILQ
jgi:hypothetical protein